MHHISICMQKQQFTKQKSWLFEIKRKPITAMPGIPIEKAQSKINGLTAGYILVLREKIEIQNGYFSWQNLFAKDPGAI